MVDFPLLSLHDGRDTAALLLTRDAITFGPRDAMRSPLLDVRATLDVDHCYSLLSGFVDTWVSPLLSRLESPSVVARGIPGVVASLLLVVTLFLSVISVF